MPDAKIPWWRTDLGAAEIAGLEQAVRGRHINGGPLCRALEERLAAELGAPHMVLTTSGSVALLLALLACDVGPGDEVVLPAGGFIAAAHAVRLLGAAVRLVDLRDDRPLLDAGRLAAALSPRTKAIVPIHLNGQACDLDAIRAVAAAHGVRVVEDCAQAFGSRDAAGACLGTRGGFGAFSMGMTKLVTTGEGGFVATPDAGAAARLRKLRNQGVEVMARNVFEGFGFNFRFNDLLAAVGLAQVAALPRKLEALRRVRAFYAGRLAGLGGVRLLENAPGEVPLWTAVLCARRNDVATALAARGIETRAFHPPLSDSAHLGCAGDFPRARYFAAHGLVLPSGPDQRLEDLERTADAMRAACREGPVPPPPAAAAEGDPHA